MRRLLWPAIAVTLLIGAAWLLAADDAPLRTPVEPNFPRWQQPEERTRAESRMRPLPVAQAPEAPADEEQPSRVRADPVLRALSGAAGKNRIVFEANALRHSNLGELAVECLDDELKKKLDETRERYGVDMLEDIDRVASDGSVYLVTGHFANARWEEVFGEGKRHDEHTTFYAPTEGSHETIAVWNGELVLMGDSEDAVLAALDRIDGRTTPEAPLDEDIAYGEMYGTLDPEHIAALLSDSQSAIADAIRETVSDIELHASAMDDVGIVATMSGDDPDRLRDLAKTLGGAISAGRIAAATTGDEALRELLDYARVSPQGDRFQLELALPQAVLERHLRSVCKNSGATP